MSEVLMLTMNSAFVPKLQPSRSGYFTATIHSQIHGHIVQEVKVLKTTANDLPIPIVLPSLNLMSGARTTRAACSPYSTPMASPRSLVSNKTFVFSPKSSKIVSHQRKNLSSKRFAEHSPKQGIGELLKNSLKQEKHEQRALKSKEKRELNMKLEKKLQMKVFDEFIRQENLNKFKQKCPLSRPKWGTDDKKVITETKILRELEKQKKKSKAKTPHLEVVSPVKHKKTSKKKTQERQNECTEDYSDQKKEIFTKIQNLTNRVEQLRLGTQAIDPKTQAAQKMQMALQRWVKRLAFNNFAENVASQSSFSSNQHLDNEVQQIMKSIKQPSEVSEQKSEQNVSYEKILENQLKINHKQQEQLIDLKVRDLQEMNKLAEVLGGNPEMKKKFEAMIERRYSKLENLFHENVENFKQVFGVNDEEQEKEEFPLPSLRNTISEFSSSFLLQLNEVPPAAMINMTFEDLPPIQGEEIDSPSDSLYSRDTLSEPSHTFLNFLSKNPPNLHQPPQEEPSIPLISESVLLELNQKHQNSADSIDQLVEGINSKSGLSISASADNTLDLKNPGIQPCNPMFILEDSYGSGESGSNANISSVIVPTENEVKEDSRHSESRSNRVMLERFPSPFTDLYESSTEIEGYELIINRILFTLEKDVFSIIFEDLKNDDEYWMNIPKKPAIAIRMSLHEFEDQVHTDSIAVLSVLKKMQKVKEPTEVLSAVLQAYNPFFMLCKVQNRLDDFEEVQIFDYSDLDSLEKSSSLSFSFNVSANPYKMTHNKMIVDAINEAMLKIAKKKVNLPWKVQNQVLVLGYEGLIRTTSKKLVKWGEIEAGKIPNRDMMNCFGGLDEERLQCVRQENLAKLLIVDVAEGDGSWIECDFEETQVAIDAAEFVMEMLVSEMEEVMRLE